MRRTLLIAITCLVASNVAVWGVAASAAAPNAKAAGGERIFNGREEIPAKPQSEKTLWEKLGEAWERFTGDAWEDEEDDADLPPIARGKINKDEYLQLRAAYIARLRGYDPDKPFDLNARSEAIKQMEKQESRARKERFNDLSVAGGDAPFVGGAWTFIGPSFLPNGQTTSVSTAVSGRVTAIDVDPTNPDIAYVGTAQGGLYRTTDAGATWTPLMDNAQTLSIGSIAVAPSDPSKVYVGTGEGNGCLDCFFGVGIYRIDNANTSSPTLAGHFNKNGSNSDVFTGTGVTKILVHPTDPNTIFASTTYGFGGLSGNFNATLPVRGVYRSTNATSANPTFTKLTVTNANNGDRRVHDMVFEPGNPNNIAVAVGGLQGSADNSAPDGGVYVTTNALAATPTFTRILTVGASSIIRSNLAINKVGSTTTLLVATGESGGGALRVSTNPFSGSATFTQLTAGNGFCGGQCFYDIFVAMDPNNASVIYLGGSANSGSGAASGRASVFQKSTDGGQTFTRIDRGLHADSHAFALAPSNPARAYFGSDGGVWRSDNVNDSTATNISWTSLNNATFSATQFQSIAVHPVDPNFTIGGTQDNGTELRKPDGTWTRADFGDGGNSVIDQNAKDATTVTMYHTYYNSTGSLLGFARVDSVNNASDAQWNFYGCGGTANGINCSDTATLFYAPLVRGPGIPNTIYYGTDRLYRSENKGVTATVVSQAPLASGVPISAIGISPQNDNVRVVGLANGKVYATTAGSSTLTDVTANLPTGRYVSRAVIDPNNQNIAYLTYAEFGLAGGTVYRTTNLSAGTVTWAAVSGSGANALPSVPVNAFVIDPQNSNLLYAGTDIGVYFSQDSGKNWLPYGTGLPRVAVFDMAATSGRQLRIATHGRGMWETAMAAANVAPSAISGKITDANGKSLPGVYVTLTGGRTDATATDANGNYSFTNLESNLSYTVTPTSEVFNFSPSNQAITLDRDRTDATFTATLKSANLNQIDAAAFFVRQHYIDFLNREPDRSGLQFWANQIASCNGDATCIDVKRQNVSAAYFLSAEFQQTGFFVYKLYKSAFGNIPNTPVPVRFANFLPDVQTIGSGVIVGQPGYQQVLDSNKQTFVGNFVNRAAFKAQYPDSLTAAQFVDALFANVGVTPPAAERQDAINAFGAGGASGRAAALQKVAESNAATNSEFAKAFVLMQYFGYLRRDPNAAPDKDFAGYNFWLTKLNNFGGDYIKSEMVRSFIVSDEYRQRFGAS